MKNIKNIFIVFAFIFSCSSHATLIFWLDPSLQDAETGDSVQVTLYASGLGDGVPPSLGAFEVDLTYDDAVLSLTSFTALNNLGDIGLFEAIDTSIGDFGGTIGLAVTSLLFPFELDPLQGETVALVDLFFSVDNLGADEHTVVGFGQTVLGFDGGGDRFLDTSTQNAIIGTVAQVPEPSTIAVFALGLMGLMLRRKT